jgi:hypothetical protein
VRTLYSIYGLLSLTVCAHAANWYVEPSAQGSANGTSWNSAWSMADLNANWANVAPGDTVWLAGGTYNTSLLITKSGTSGNVITIGRAISSSTACTGAAGWSSAFDSQVVLAGTGGNHSSQIEVEASYITVNGNENSGSLYTNSRVYGIQCVSPSAGGSNILWNYPTTGTQYAFTNVSFYNIDCLGPFNSQTITSSSNTAGIEYGLYSGSSSTNLLLHDCRIWGSAESIRENNSNGSIYEYCWIGCTADDVANYGDHEDICLTYPGASETWRFNVIYGSPNDGFIFDPGGFTNWRFYGNLYVTSGSGLIIFNNPSSAVYSAYVANNVFASPDTDFANPGLTSSISNNGPGWVGQTYVYNNIFWNVSNSLQMYGGATLGNVTSNYNAYNAGSGGIPSTSNEPNSVTLTTSPFVTPIDSAITTLTGTLSSGSNVITGLSSTTGLATGMTVVDASNNSGLFYPAFIRTVNSSSSITISTKAPSSGSVSLQFYGWGNYQLTAAASAILNKGLALPAPYNTDGTGATRTSGTWSIGAFQYGGGSQIPLAPGNLRFSQQ